MSVLERGGNAFDAAVAGAFVLYVAEPDQNGLGGEVPILVWTAAERRVQVICGQGPTPMAATPEAFSRLGLGLIPGSGALPACVPGAFDAWMLLLREFGTWSVRDVLGSAIDYARNGVPVSPGLANRIAGVADQFQRHWPTSAAVYLVGGLPQSGQRLRNRALAALLERTVIAAETASTERDGQIDAARRDWRTGFVPEAAFRWLRGRSITDLEGRSDTVLLAMDDWAGYAATIEEAVTGQFYGATVYKAGAWSQGPALLESLTLLEQADIARTGIGTEDHVHRVVEALKLAFADREAWYGDPAFVDVPLDALLSVGYASERMRLIGARASRDLVPGAPAGRAPRLPSRVTTPIDAVTQGAASVRATRGLATAGDTAHIEVVDRHRNVVSAAPSGGWLQSSPVIPDLGFPLGTRAQTMWLESGLANSLAPGKRPRTTLSPTIVLTRDEAVIGCGSPGGDAQEQWTLEFLLATLIHGLPLQAAADSSTFQSLHMPSSFWPRRSRPGVLQMEAGWDGAVVNGLRERGHEVEVIPDRSQGWICAVGVEPSGFVSSAASQRGRNCTSVAR